MVDDIRHPSAIRVSHIPKGWTAKFFGPITQASSDVTTRTAARTVPHQSEDYWLYLTDGERETFYSVMFESSDIAGNLYLPMFSTELGADSYKVIAPRVNLSAGRYQMTFEQDVTDSYLKQTRTMSSGASMKDLKLYEGDSISVNNISSGTTLSVFDSSGAEIAKLSQNSELKVGETLKPGEVFSLQLAGGQADVTVSYYVKDMATAGASEANKWVDRHVIDIADGDQIEWVSSLDNPIHFKEIWLISSSAQNSPDIAPATEAPQAQQQSTTTPQQNATTAQTSQASPQKLSSTGTPAPVAAIVAAALSLLVLIIRKRA